MRFIAPERATLSPAQLALPVFGSLQPFMGLLTGPAWPAIARVNESLQLPTHQVTGQPLALLAQEDIDDAEGYEPRIFHRGRIATRSRNWHDLFNALAWKLFPRIKSALNAAQVDDIARLGTAQRSRRQCAMTQFDEAGAVLVVRDSSLLQPWDGHGWQALFLRNRSAWVDGRLQLFVIGHALFEHALQPGMLLVSKTLVLIDEVTQAPPPTPPAQVDLRVAQLISGNRFLTDPQELRPLPLTGIPGWSACLQDQAFFEDTPCFRPARPGRSYGLPLALCEAITSPRENCVRAASPSA